MSFERQTRHLLKHYRRKPSPAVWQGIEASLDASAPASSVRRRPWLQAAAGIAALMLAFWSGYWWNDYQTPSSQSPVLPPRSVASDTAPGTMLMEGLLLSEVDQHPAVPSRRRASPAGHASGAASGSPDPVRRFSPKPSSDGGKLRPDASASTRTRDAAIQESESVRLAASRDHPSYLEPAAIRFVRAFRVHPVEPMPGRPVVASALKPSAPAASSHTPDEAVQEVDRNAFKRYPGRWSLSIEGGVNTGRPVALETRPREQISYQGPNYIRESQTDASNPQSGYTLGLRAQYDWKPHWQLWSGLDVLRYQNRQSGSTTEYYILPGASGSIDTLAFQANSQSFMNRFTALRIPMGIDYRLRSSRLEAAVGAGVSMERLISARYIFIDEASGTITRRRNPSFKSMDRYRMEGILELKMSYALTNRHALYVKGATFMPLCGSSRGQHMIRDRVDHLMMGINLRL